MHQEGRLQSVVEMTESLRSDVSSNFRNIDRLYKRAIADRIERDGMVTTIAQQGVTIAQQGVKTAQQGVTIAQLCGTFDYLKGCVIADRTERDGMDTKIAEQDVRIRDLDSTIVDLKRTLVDLEGKIVNRTSDNDEERRYRACTEIVFGIQPL